MNELAEELTIRREPVHISKAENIAGDVDVIIRTDCDASKCLRLGGKLVQEAATVLIKSKNSRAAGAIPGLKHQ